MAAGHFDILRRVLGWLHSPTADATPYTLTLYERTNTLTLKKRTVRAGLYKRVNVLTLKDGG